MNIMIIGASSFNNISSTYTVKLNKEESLEVTKEKVQQSPDAKKLEEEKELQDKKDIKSGAAKELSEGEEALVDALSARDAEVRAHESAHMSVGGGLTGPASFTYQQGPDGKMYAIGGEVSISMQSGSTPEETIANARQVAAAAMAAGDPSSQDFAVASSARVMEMKAQQQLSREQQEETLGKETYANGMNEQSSQKSSNQTNPLDFIDISA